MGGICFKPYPVEHIQAEQILAEDKKKSEIKLLLLGMNEGQKDVGENGYFKEYLVKNVQER